MRKMYLSAPLPFMGQKRMFAREYIKVLEGFKDARERFVVAHHEMQKAGRDGGV